MKNIGRRVEVHWKKKEHSHFVLKFAVKVCTDINIYASMEQHVRHISCEAIPAREIVHNMTSHTGIASRHIEWYLGKFSVEITLPFWLYRAVPKPIFPFLFHKDVRFKVHFGPDDCQWW